MKPWLEDSDCRLFHGDALDVLRELPSGSVHMCATSPPFFGLRDYQTGSWEGGDEGCDHQPEMDVVRAAAQSANLDKGGSTRNQEEAERSRRQFRVECGKCGARRTDQQIGLEETPSCNLHGLMRLRSDLTPDQRAFVLQGLLAVAPRDA